MPDRPEPLIADHRGYWGYRELTKDELARVGGSGCGCGCGCGCGAGTSGSDTGTDTGTSADTGTGTDTGTGMSEADTEISNELDLNPNLTPEQLDQLTTTKSVEYNFPNAEQEPDRFTVTITLANGTTVTGVHGPDGWESLTGVPTNDQGGEWSVDFNMDTKELTVTKTYPDGSSVSSTHDQDGNFTGLSTTPATEP